MERLNSLSITLKNTLLLYSSTMHIRVHSILTKETLVKIIGVILCVYALGTTFIRIPILQYRSLYMLFVLTLTFLLYPSSRKGNKVIKLIDLILITLSIITSAYVAFFYSDLIARYYSPAIVDLICGIIFIAIVLEGTRRAVGLPMCLVAISFLIYCFLGRYVPGYFGHPGFPNEMIIGYIYQTFDGIFGIVLGVGTAEITLFTIFGSLLGAGGAGYLFSDIGRSLFGKSSGGGIRASNILAYLMGMVAGSSTATAIVSYSMMKDSIDEDMKKLGKETIAAYLAAAGTGALISPPVMGAVAFIMAYMAGVPYIEVCRMAILVTVLYYFALFVVADILARKSGLSGLPPEKIPSLKNALKERGHMFIPIIILIALLLQGFTPVGAAFWASISIILISMIRKETRMTPKKLITGFQEAARALAPIAMMCACAGIIVASIMLTGIGVKLSIAISQAAEVHLLVALLIAMIFAIILGMGLPPAPVYILVAILIVPALTHLGIPAPIAHFFVFYYACFSVLTPPVAVTAYAMAGILRANAFKSGWLSMIFSLPMLILPFTLPYAPEILMIGSWDLIALRFAIWCIAIISLSTFIWGYYPVWGTRLSTPTRLASLICSALTIYPNYVINVIGIAIFIVLIVFVKVIRGQNA